MFSYESLENISEIALNIKKKICEQVHYDLYKMITCLPCNLLYITGSGQFIKLEVEQILSRESSYIIVPWNFKLRTYQKHKYNNLMLEKYFETTFISISIVEGALVQTWKLSLWVPQAIFWPVTGSSRVCVIFQPKLNIKPLAKPKVPQNKRF